MIKILLVDDEVDILNLLKYTLEKKGYEVYECKDSLEAFGLAKKIVPDIFILDVMMPKKNGFELCALIRENELLKDKYVFFLTALVDEQNHIKGIKTGADDYLMKPISMKILETKLERVADKVRQQKKMKQNNELIFDDLTINIDSWEVFINGVNIPLARKEFEVLHLLAAAPGQLFQRETILRKVWGDDIIVTERTVDVHITKLRKKLGVDCIKTFKGIGYKFEYQH